MLNGKADMLVPTQNTEYCKTEQYSVFEAEYCSEAIESIEEVVNFIYLSSIFAASGATDINARIRKTKHVLTFLKISG